MPTQLELAAYTLAAGIGALALRKLQIRLRLSRAKHPSLRGHARMSQALARLLPYYAYDEQEFFACDGAPAAIVAQRREAMQQLSDRLQARAPISQAKYRELESGLADVEFVNKYRVPFQFRECAGRWLKLAPVYTASDGIHLQDLDGHWHHDLGGSYGVNVFGYEFYKTCIEQGVKRVATLGPVLGPYHPLVADNVARLQEISGLDQVSFHMSGTEAVMQAVRLARYHTGRSHLVRFCGAYHGWWDGVQPGIGNPRPVQETYTLKEMDDATLRVLSTRNNIACVLVNPLQALHPNANAPGDATLISSDRNTDFDPAAYVRWLQQLRRICDQRGIVLIFDEVFLGFRLALKGAQDYFGVTADLVTYGKTLGGGLPVGVVCGKRALMRRYREDRPTHVCFARGTFNSHPYVMATMNEFLRKVMDPATAPDYAGLDRLWQSRLDQVNQRLVDAGLGLRLAGLASIWTVLYERPGRYNWLLQYYMADQGLALSWVGSGRLIFPHDLGDEDFDAIVTRLLAAATRMQQDGWNWQSPGLSNRSIKRRVLNELIQTAFRGIRRRWA